MVDEDTWIEMSRHWHAWAEGGIWTCWQKEDLGTKWELVGSWDLCVEWGLEARQKID